MTTDLRAQFTENAIQFDALTEQAGIPDDLKQAFQDNFNQFDALMVEMLGENDRLQAALNAAWHSVKDKQPPEQEKQTVLVAWEPYAPTSPWDVDVLVHWPDGAWANLLEEEIGEDEVPHYYQEIQFPTTPLNKKSRNQ